MSAVKNKERTFFTTFNLNLLKIKEIILYSIITIPLMNIKGLISSCDEITRRDRNRNGGGVCFYIKTSINFVIRHDLNMNDLENLCLEIQNHALSHSS